MKIRKLFATLSLLSLSAFFLLNACTKEEAEKRRAANFVPVISGLEVRDELGNSLWRIGQPNAKLSVNTDGEEYRIACLGNTLPPSSSFFGVYISSSVPDIIASIWVVKARFDPHCLGNYISLETINNFNSTAMIAGGAPLMSTEKELPGSGAAIAMETKGLEEGFYRVYLQINDQLLWDDLVISHEFEFPYYKN